MSPGRNSHRGFSLVELVLSIGVLTLTILTLAGFMTVTVRNREKAEVLSEASNEMERLLERTMTGVRSDTPAGTRDSFMTQDAETPWRAGSFKSGRTEYEYALRVQSVGGVGSEDLNNRLKRLEVELFWGSSQESGGARQGYGMYRLVATRLVREVVP